MKALALASLGWVAVLCAAACEDSSTGSGYVPPAVAPSPTSVVGAPEGGPPTQVEDAGVDAADAAPAPCVAAASYGTRVSLTFDATNREWVKSLTWVDGNGTTTANLAASGGPAYCGGVQEFFGESYGAPEGTAPYTTTGGTLAAFTECDASHVKIQNQPTDCNSKLPTAPVATEYTFFTGAKDSQIRISRTFTFDATTPVYPGIGLRPYVPRLPASRFTQTLIPDAGGIPTAAPVGSCGGDCFTPAGTGWNGKWLAQLDPLSGIAMIVLRDPSLTTPVELTVNYDLSSGSNLSSFVLLQPADGFKAPVTEVEYLCFTDLTTWPQAARDAGTLPSWCGP